MVNFSNTLTPCYLQWCSPYTGCPSLLIVLEQESTGIWHFRNYHINPGVVMQTASMRLGYHNCVMTKIRCSIRENSGSFYSWPRRCRKEHAIDHEIGYCISVLV